MPTINIYISHIQNNDQLVLFVGHTNELALKLAKKAYFPKHDTTITIHRIELDNDAEYKSNIRNSIHSYLKNIFKNLDITTIRKFLYTGDCNLGYPAQKIFPDFLAHENEFLCLLTSTLPENASSEFFQHINIKRILYSATTAVLEEAQESFEKSRHYDNIFYEKDPTYNDTLRTTRQTWNENIGSESPRNTAVEDRAIVSYATHAKADKLSLPKITKNSTIHQTQATNLPQPSSQNFMRFFCFFSRTSSTPVIPRANLQPNEYRILDEETAPLSNPRSIEPNVLRSNLG